MIKQYVFTSDYQTQAVYVPHFQTAPIAMFKKGDIYQLFSEIAPGVPTHPGSLMFRYNLPNNVGVAQYSIPMSVVKEYKIKRVKNAIKNETMSSSYVSSKPYIGSKQYSSYLGEGIIAKKSQQTKNILVIIAMLAILIVAYLAVTGKLFKSLELN